MKKIISILSIILTVLLILVGCSDPQATQPDKVEETENPSENVEKPVDNSDEDESFKI